MIVVDGGKGLAKAISTTFDSYAVIQRCQVHKMATQIAADLRKVNESAARSFTEGLDDVLTLCSLGLTRCFKKSFGSTNIVESANVAIARRTRHISRWSTGNQRLRWCALALAELEGNNATGTTRFIAHDCLCCSVP